MEFRHKGHFRIIHAKTGELLATFPCEEDNQSVDMPTLRRFLPDYERKNMSIARVVWEGYDEVAVFVKAKKKPDDPKGSARDKRIARRRKRRRGRR